MACRKTSVTEPSRNSLKTYSISTNYAATSSTLHLLLYHGSTKQVFKDCKLAFPFELCSSGRWLCNLFRYVSLCLHHTCASLHPPQPRAHQKRRHSVCHICFSSSLLHHIYSDTRLGGFLRPASGLEKTIVYAQLNLPCRRHHPAILCSKSCGLHRVPNSTRCKRKYSLGDRHGDDLRCRGH